MTTEQSGEPVLDVYLRTNTQAALFSPSEVHDGSWKEVWKTRDQALQRYYVKNPERFRHRPTTPAPASQAGINLPETKTPK